MKIWEMVPNKLELYYEPKPMEKVNRPFTIRIAKASMETYNENFCYPMHQHDTYELIIPYKKAYQCKLNNTCLTIEPGQCILIQPGDIHEDYYSFEEEIFFLRFDILDIYSNIWQYGVCRLDSMVESRILDLAGDQVSRILLDALLMLKCSEFSALMSFEKLGEAISWNIISNIPRQKLSEKFANGLLHGTFQMQVINYFEQHIHETLNAADMALKLGMSKRSMEYKFKEIYGAGPVHSFTRYKISQAAQMLASGKRVKHVAEYFGFSDQFYFSTVFKKVIGVSPSRMSKKLLR